MIEILFEKRQISIFLFNLLTKHSSTIDYAVNLRELFDNMNLNFLINIEPWEKVVDFLTMKTPLLMKH